MRCSECSYGGVDPAAAIFPWNAPLTRHHSHRAVPGDRPALYLSPNPQVPSPALRVGTTRGMQAFSIDDARLSDVVAQYAPSASVVNLG
jgi:hypothetical protein